MSRNLTAPMIAGIQSHDVAPCILVDVTFVSGPMHLWAGIGSITWNGNTYLGVGDVGGIGDIIEGSEVKADGTTISLSGIDPVLLNDCLNDIKLGAPVTIWVGLLTPAATVVDSPYPLFVGTVDRPVIPIAPDSLTITLACETRMSNLQRASNRRLTAADQRYYYPDDIGLNWVEVQNDVGERWG